VTAIIRTVVIVYEVFMEWNSRLIDSQCQLEVVRVHVHGSVLMGVDLDSEVMVMGACVETLRYPHPRVVVRCVRHLPTCLIDSKDE